MASGTPSSRIFVRNLPPALSESDFRAHFSKDGPITDAKYFQKRRIGYVGYKTPEDAAKAVKYFNKSFIRMSKIAVELAIPLDDQNIKLKQNDTKNKAKTTTKDDAENPLKRKREQPTSAAQPSDPKLKEFLNVMQATAKTKTWQNDTSNGDDVVMAELKDVLADESDDEIQTIFSKRTKSKEVNADGDVPTKDESTKHEAASEIPKPQSDHDWLRSKKGALLDDDQAVEEPATKSELEEDHAVPEQESENAADDNITQIEQYGRLFLRNLPYTITEDEIRESFGVYGQLLEVQVPMDTSKGTAKGFSFVKFQDPRDAVQAFQAFDGKTFQGRLIHIMPAKVKKDNKLDDFAISQLPLKQQMKIKRKMESSAATHKWNPLYMNMDDVMSSVSARLGIEKSELVDATSSDAAVKQALAETHVIQEVKQYFSQNGVDLDSFNPRQTRGDTAILVKNFPHGTQQDEIRKLFSPYGQIIRLLVPPSGTMALVEFAHAPEGRAAFDALKYRRVKDTILFLEKAPKDVFTGAVTSAAIAPIKSNAVEAKLSTSDLLQDTPVQEASETSTLFVRNLNFTTTTDLLKQIFAPLSGFSSARVKLKSDPKRPNEILSMGFGFIEFKTKADAQAAIAAMNGYVLEGHKLDIRPSQRVIDAGEDQRKSEKAKALASQQTKVIVKNLPFEATKKDVRTLLSNYGQLRSVRVPQKFDKSARGFAFAEFTTPREAANAMTALKSTHLLGRKLHMEYAEAESIDPEAEIERMQKKVGSQVDKVALQKLTGSGRKKFNVAAEGEA